MSKFGGGKGGLGRPEESDEEVINLESEEESKESIDTEEEQG